MFSSHRFSRNSNSLDKVLWKQLLQNFKQIWLKNSGSMATFHVRPSENYCWNLLYRMASISVKKCWSTFRKSFTPTSKVWMLLHRFSRSSRSTNNILQELPTEFHENSTHSLVNGVVLYGDRQTDTQPDRRMWSPNKASVKHTWKHKK